LTKQNIVGKGTLGIVKVMQSNITVTDSLYSEGIVVDRSQWRIV